MIRQNTGPVAANLFGRRAARVASATDPLDRCRLAYAKTTARTSRTFPCLNGLDNPIT